MFSSVQSLSPTLCDPMNCSTPGLPVHHQLLEFTQTQRPSSRWCHPAISSSVVPFLSCPQSLPASESFPLSQLFAWGGQSTGVSALASFLAKNKLVSKKAEEPEIKLPTSDGSSKKQESSRKTSISALLTMPKALTVWIIINCEKFWKRWEYQTTWPDSWETCMQVRKQQLELDKEQQTGSK